MVQVSGCTTNSRWLFLLEGNNMSFIKKYWKIIAYIIAGLLVIHIGYTIYNLSMEKIEAKKQADKQIHELVQEHEENIAVLENKLAISEDNAQSLKAKLKKIQASNSTVKPDASFYVSAGTVQEASTKVAEVIKNGDANLPKEATEKSDRTIITPITKDAAGNPLPAEKQKVDVYKINLKKDHKVKAGIAVVNDKAHPVIGYEQGKIEGLVYFNGKKLEGVSVMYNLLEW